MLGRNIVKGLDQFALYIVDLNRSQIVNGHASYRRESFAKFRFVFVVIFSFVFVLIGLGLVYLVIIGLIIRLVIGVNTDDWIQAFD